MLVYNKDRSITFEITMPDELESLFGDLPKIFVWGHIDKNKQFIIGERATFQQW